MTNTEFKALLKEVFDTHLFSNKRDHHTINELLHCMRYDERFKEFHFNISIVTKDDNWWCIPTIDSFVDTKTLGIWFDDDKIEYEHEVVDDGGYLFYYDCITLYEKEDK